MTAHDPSANGHAGPGHSGHSSGFRPAARVSPNFITEIIERDLQEGRYPQIVTRFPPEPSGYAHLGHVFASFLDFQTAVQYGGRYHLRMDDTNPALATQEYAEAIADDLRWLGWDWGEHLYYASDNFERYYAYAEQLITQGDAYVDSVSPDEMARLRGNATTPGSPSPYRDRTPEENLDLFRRMRAGEFADGQHALRAKIDLGSPNMKLRDPVLYRILRGHHYRTGNQWCIYPMYDFQHPLQDALEGVTHSMCSLEFVDNRAIYDWLMDKLGFEPRPHQYEFGRRGLEYTITSKRKLRRLIEERVVNGWDDPRMPTLRAQRRLGVTPEAVRAFAAQIGVSRTNRTVDISVYENAVRDDLNHRAPRVMAVLDPLPVTLSDLEGARTLSLPYWPFDVIRDSPDGLVGLPDGRRVTPEEAVRQVPLSSELYIEREDFHADPPKGYKRLTPGGTVRLRGAGIIRADRFETDEAGQVTRVHATLLGEEAKAGGVIHWVSAAQALPAEFRLYDRLFRVPNPEGENPEDSGSELNPPDFDPEHMSHENEASSLDAGFLRFLNPDSLRVHQGFVEPSVANDPQDTRYQFERQGYFWRDPVDSREDALVFGRIITLKDTWGKGAQTAAPQAAAPRKTAPKEDPAPAAPQKVHALSPEQEAEASRLRALGAAEADARTLARDPQLLTFLNDALADSTFGQVASWTVNDMAGLVRAGQVKISAADLAPLASLLAGGQITTRVARDTLTRSAASGEAPAVIIEREGLNAGLSENELQGAIEAVLAANPDKVEAYRSGRTALMGFFTGQVMRATGGKADPKQVAAGLTHALNGK
ncbi:glutamine--tRNA ligase/YqeY domain fusion protein [Deinococcus deserti]|uniref:Glutamine--tRNA ligase n=1 Tax=Deinococcus deserti (strain DSM 17065 / CIP 109153 / LMG 22923 / VCD115) TaxID=546414 RepID=C1CY94_DEIDV|nr:glutamine--tRNA ligase/YqeY domain fusion protein [Deinococcus deserti]ACO44915.1 putative Glutaminyl-tRNA synthetase (Glutamine--tRNA ligase) (GlnRS) [Deinococcus deserti VCD115]